MSTRAAILFPLVFFGFACGKMDPKECTKLRDEAFTFINSASVCSTDADCRESEWPGCPKPISVASFDKIKGIGESFLKGKCEEPPKQKCPQTPKVFCQEGLCAFRYKPAEGEMKIETK